MTVQAYQGFPDAGVVFHGEAVRPPQITRVGNQPCVLSGSFWEGRESQSSLEAEKEGLSYH